MVEFAGFCPLYFAWKRSHPHFRDIGAKRVNEPKTRICLKF